MLGPLAVPGNGVGRSTGRCGRGEGGDRRKSGRVYHTPVNAFRADGGYIIALTYGARAPSSERHGAANRAESGLSNAGELDWPQQVVNLTP